MKTQQFLTAITVNFRAQCSIKLKPLYISSIHFPWIVPKPFCIESSIMHTCGVFILLSKAALVDAPFALPVSLPPTPSLPIHFRHFSIQLDQWTWVGHRAGVNLWKRILYIKMELIDGAIFSYDVGWCSIKIVVFGFLQAIKLVFVSAFLLSIC